MPARLALLDVGAQCLAPAMLTHVLIAHVEHGALLQARRNRLRVRVVVSADGAKRWALIAMTHAALALQASICQFLVQPIAHYALNVLLDGSIQQSDRRNVPTVQLAPMRMPLGLLLAISVMQENGAGAQARSGRTCARLAWTVIVGWAPSCRSTSNSLELIGVL